MKNIERSAQQGKYLTLKLDREHFGISLSKVQEIVRMSLTIKVPQTPDHVRGVFGLRGKIVPMIDLRTCLGFPKANDTALSCIIVVQVSRANKPWQVGIVVDEVSDVVEFKAEQLEAPPDFGASTPMDLILAMGKVDTRVVTLLNIERALDGISNAELPH